MSCVRSSSLLLFNDRRELFDALARLGHLLEDLRDHRMLRRDGHERHAEHGVDAGRERLDLRLDVLDVERERDAFALADPVALHRADAFRPALQPVEAFQQPLDVLGDLEEPLREVAPLDRRAAAPAAPVLHLLVREHRSVDRAPVDRRLALVREPLLEHADEEPLVPAVVVGIARRELARPVVARPHEPDLAPHVLDVLARPRLGMDLRWIAAFSAGSPNASQPIGCTTFCPSIRWMRAIASPSV